MELLADVAVPVPLAHAFTYRCRPRSRRACGRARAWSASWAGAASSAWCSAWASASRRRGSPSSRSRRSSIPSRCCPPSCSPSCADLGQYYFAPIGEVLRLALPAMEREQVRALAAQGELGRGRVVAAGRRRAGWRTRGHGRDRGAGHAARAGGGDPRAAARRRRAARRAARGALRQRAPRGEEARRARPRRRGAARGAARPLLRRRPRARRPPELNAAQAEAAARIAAALDGEADAARAFLLFGVTGSGKTEVYLRAIAACLARGKGALVMVPGDRAHAAARLPLPRPLRRRPRRPPQRPLASPTATPCGRASAAARSSVAIGARSALFAPVPDLGLVIVDEEHDSSFKQEEGVRYHARDMALSAPTALGAVVVLGLRHALARVGRARPPRQARRAASSPTAPSPRPRSPPSPSSTSAARAPGPTGDRLLSLPLHRALEETLRRRRAGHPLPQPPRLRAERRLRLVRHRRDLPVVLRRAHLPPRPRRRRALPLLRLPRPAPRRVLGVRRARAGARGPRHREARGHPRGRVPERARGAPRSRRRRGARGRGDPRPDARRARSTSSSARRWSPRATTCPTSRSSASSTPTPRSACPTFAPRSAASSSSCRSPVARVGASGRAACSSRRARRSTRPSSSRRRTTCAASGRASSPIAREVGYPPFSRLALLRIDALDEDDARGTANTLAAIARTTKEALDRRVDVLGPSAAPLARLRGRFRFRVMLRAAERGPLRAVLRGLQEGLARVDRRVRAVVDVDPVAML